ncbi:diguanylate cyclase domain-containing protein [Bifidobacterium pseudocatenulatum]|uniref:diguanylate cyclase domain-containing protein n=1 Tax=Bifidobacterium pseudocatenulatum TaxID=28026 RepID=UPI0022E1AB17|nr:diguanylate cyclase [Bifidobacterium pseudocatenulatum]
MTSKQSKHQAATGSQPKDGIRKPARLTILAIIYALCIAAAIAFHAQEGVQQLMEDPARICIWSLCFLLCLIYHKKRSSYRVAAEHTVLPPLTVILLVTGYFPDVAMFLIIVTIITSIITARSLKIGILRAGTTLAPIPLIKILFANTSHVLSIIISQNSVNAAINPYQFQHWLLPLLIMTVAVPIIRLICDIVTFFFVQIPIRKAMREYSLSHILAMALADLMAIVWIPEILEFANIGSDTATVLSVFMLALIAYSLLLMTVDTMSRLTRSRSALKCIANVSDALPLPNQVPEETVVRRINRGLTRMRCFISNANNLDKRGYSYRYSAPISTGSRQYYLAMERSIWNRPFMSTDETILLTCGEVLTESLRVNKEVTLLRTESETDTLTGALTYRAFIGHLKSLQTENVHNLVAVVYFGVEHLRTVNEHYGRKIGNAVLRSVGMRLSQLLPGNATLSRVNGAEFAMIVTDVTSTSDVEELATRMRNLAVMPVYTEEGEVSVDVSSSISFSNATDGFSVLLADASAHIYESESSNLPVVDGMTSTLDVLETCVKDMTAFRKVAPELDIVDICMNGSELGASIFHERLEQLTHEQPQLRFGLQLGSHAIHVVHDEVDDEVAALAALPNVELGLTNAGTTYSEVAAFAHLPLDFARFDKTVVRDFRTPRAKQIMQRTLEISRDNDAFHVVFDGVESLDQVEFIRSIGGTLAEGTLLSNAMSANEFLMRLETMGTSLPEAAPRQAE